MHYFFENRLHIENKILIHNMLRKSSNKLIYINIIIIFTLKDLRIVLIVASFPFFRATGRTSPTTTILINLLFLLPFA